MKVKIEHGQVELEGVITYLSPNSIYMDGRTYIVEDGCIKGELRHNYQFNMASIKHDTEYWAKIVLENNEIKSVTIEREVNPIVEDNTDANAPTMTHPSWGMISISKPSGGDSQMFMSNAKHNSYYEIEIRQALVKKTSLDYRYEDKYITEGKSILQIKLSREQLMRLLYNYNGEAIPCTIISKNGDYIPFAEGNFNTLQSKIKNLIAIYIGTNSDASNLFKEFMELSKQPFKKEVKDRMAAIINNLQKYLSEGFFYSLSSLMSEYEEEMTKEFLNTKE